MQRVAHALDDAPDAQQPQDTHQPQ